VPIVLVVTAPAVNSSVAPVAPGFPPKAKAAVDVPVPPTASLAVFILESFPQIVPFQVSVLVPTLGAGAPLKANPAAGAFPAHPAKVLATFKSLSSVQLVPLKNSVSATVAVVSPPTAKTAVFVFPKPPKFLFAVFKSPVSVQLLPFQVSVRA